MSTWRPTATGFSMSARLRMGLRGVSAEGKLSGRVLRWGDLLVSREPRKFTLRFFGTSTGRSTKICKPRDHRGRTGSPWVRLHAIRGLWC